jgi:hypothetical protein
MSRLRLLTVALPLLAGLLAAGCGGGTEAGSTAAAPTTGAAAAAPSSAAPPAAPEGAFPAFTGDPVAHANAAIGIFEAGAKKQKIKTRKINVILVGDQRRCTADSNTVKDFSGTDLDIEAKPLELCVKDKPYTIAVSAALYPKFATETPNELIGLLLQRWAVGVVELNGSDRNMLAAGCVAGGTLAGAKDDITAAEFDAVVAWSDKIFGEYNTGFGKADENMWETCKLIGTVK